MKYLNKYTKEEIKTTLITIASAAAVIALGLFLATPQLQMHKSGTVIRHRANRLSSFKYMAS